MTGAWEGMGEGSSQNEVRMVRKGYGEKFRFF